MRNEEAKGMRTMGAGYVGDEPMGGMGRPVVHGKGRVEAEAEAEVAGNMLRRWEKKGEKGWWVRLLCCILVRESCD
jgi:hypothetical protein